MNMQEAFDKIATHLATQGKRSVKRKKFEDEVELCLYRSPDGLSCAVGCLIPDELYKEKLEGSRAWTIFDMPEFEKLGDYLMEGIETGYEMDRFVGFMGAMQGVHDSETFDIKTELLDVAIQYRLDPAILNTLKFPDVWK